jgi:hypothetical protein
LAFQKGLDWHNYYRHQHHVSNLTLESVISYEAQSLAEDLYLDKNASGSSIYGLNTYKYCTTENKIDTDSKEIIKLFFSN